MKGRERRGLPQEEDDMRLLTIFELASRSTPELHVIYRDAFNEVARCEIGSADQHSALANLENVRRVLRSRPLQGPKGP